MIAAKSVSSILTALSCMWGTVATIPKVALAQETAPLPLEGALKFHSFGALSSPMGLSSDGKLAAYVVQDNSAVKTLDRDAWLRTGFGSSAESIYVADLETGKATDLTGQTSESSFPAWSPDGRYLAFLSDRDGSGQAKLWICERGGHNLRKLSDIPARTSEIVWTPDSRSILITAMPEGLSAEEYVKKVNSVAGTSKPVTPKIPDSTVTLYQSTTAAKSGEEPPQSDPWNLNWNLRDLIRISTVDGKAKILVHGRKIAAVALSPDGSQVAYTIPNRFEKPGSQQILFDLGVVSMQTGQERILASDIRLDYDGAPFSWSPNGKLIGYHVGGPYGNRLRDCYVVNASGGTPRNITGLAPLAHPAVRRSTVPLWDSEGNIYFVHDGSLWRASSDGDSAVRVASIPGRVVLSVLARSRGFLWTPGEGKSAVVVTHDDAGEQNGFYGVDLETGKSTTLLERGQYYERIPQLAVSGDGKRVVYFAEDSEHDTDLWYNDAKFKSARRITHLNPQFDQYTMGEARLIDWVSDDGQPLRGALLLPAGYQQGKRYPLIAWVYGGEQLSNRVDHFGLFERGPFNLQLLATRGYAVLLPDAPQHLGTPMLDLAKTVLPAINKVVEMGIADRDRLGVLGQSYGGYCVLSLIVQTKRFKAAVESDGYGDLVAAYGAMSKSGTAYNVAIEEQGQGLMGGTPWEYRDRYIENSPLFHLDRIDTPLLILHGSDDAAVASFLGDELFVDLRRLGKEVEYAKYQGEGHSAIDWSYANQLDFCSRMVAWFDKYLKAGAQISR